MAKDSVFSRGQGTFTFGASLVFRKLKRGAPLQRNTSLNPSSSQYLAMILMLGPAMRDTPSILERSTNITSPSFSQSVFGMPRIETKISRNTLNSTPEPKKGTGFERSILAS